MGASWERPIDAEKMYQAVQEAVVGRIKKENLSLEKPAFMKYDLMVLDDDENIGKSRKKMNGYAKTKITFTVGDSKRYLSNIF